MPNGLVAEATAVNVTLNTATSVLNIINSSFEDVDYPDSARGFVIGALPGNASTQCHIHGSLNLTVGTGATAVTIFCFNNKNVQIGQSLGPLNVTAGNRVQLPFDFVDNNPRGIASYFVQVQMTGATGNSTVNDAVGCADMVG